VNIAVPFSCDASALPRVDEAIRLIGDRISPVTDHESVPLHKAGGRVLAEDARALVSMPPCDRSAMDGYAFRHGAGDRLRLAGASLPGNPFVGKVSPGECIAIATGGAMPAGCDTVAMREHCDISADVILVRAAPSAHVRRRGEDFAVGDIVAKAGTRLDPRHIGLLAGAGLAAVAVRRRLRVAVFSVGNELGAAAIDAVPDANRAMLMTACEDLGADVTDGGILPDRRETIARVLAELAAHHDVVISSAGTSVGEEDHVRDALLDCGGEMLLAGVAIKPGKPIAFGRIGQALHIALPGNPAAAFLTFAVMGAPLLRHAGGALPRPAPWLRVRAAFSHTKKPGMREYLRVTLTQDRGGNLMAVKTGKDGSAMLASLATSDGVACLPEEMDAVTRGMSVSCCAFAGLMAP
jgi:molybdopterin molybdotransferase